MPNYMQKFSTYSAPVYESHHYAEGNGEEFLALKEIEIYDESQRKVILVNTKRFVDLVSTALYQIEKSDSYLYEYIKYSKVIYLPTYPSNICDTMCVDDKGNLFISCHFVYNHLKMNVTSIKNILLHELFHNLLGHLGEMMELQGNKELTKEQMQKYNVFADYEVNCSMVDGNLCSENFWNKFGGLYKKELIGHTFKDLYTHKPELYDEYLKRCHKKPTEEERKLMNKIKNAIETLNDPKSTDEDKKQAQKDLEDAMNKAYPKQDGSKNTKYQDEQAGVDPFEGKTAMEIIYYGFDIIKDSILGSSGVMKSITDLKKTIEENIKGKDIEKISDYNITMVTNDINSLQAALVNSGTYTSKRGDLGKSEEEIKEDIKDAIEALIDAIDKITDTESNNDERRMSAKQFVEMAKDLALTQSEKNKKYNREEIEKDRSPRKILTDAISGLRTSPNVVTSKTATDLKSLENIINSTKDDYTLFEDDTDKVKEDLHSDVKNAIKSKALNKTEKEGIKDVDDALKKLLKTYREIIFQKKKKTTDDELIDMALDVEEAFYNIDSGYENSEEETENPRDIIDESLDSLSKTAKLAPKTRDAVKKLKEELNNIFDNPDKFDDEKQDALEKEINELEENMIKDIQKQSKDGYINKNEEEAKYDVEDAIASLYDAIDSMLDENATDSDRLDAAREMQDKMYNVDSGFIDKDNPNGKAGKNMKDTLEELRNYDELSSKSRSLAKEINDELSQNAVSEMSDKEYQELDDKFKELAKSIKSDLGSYYDDKYEDLKERDGIMDNDISGEDDFDGDDEGFDGDDEEDGESGESADKKFSAQCADAARKMRSAATALRNKKDSDALRKSFGAQDAVNKMKDAIEKMNEKHTYQDPYQVVDDALEKLAKESKMVSKNTEKAIKELQSDIQDIKKYTDTGREIPDSSVDRVLDDIDKVEESLKKDAKSQIEADALDKEEETEFADIEDTLDKLRDTLDKLSDDSKDYEDKINAANDFADGLQDIDPDLASDYDGEDYDGDGDDDEEYEAPDPMDMLADAVDSISASPMLSKESSRLAQDLKDEIQGMAGLKPESITDDQVNDAVDTIDELEESLKKDAQDAVDKGFLNKSKQKAVKDVSKAMEELRNALDAATDPDATEEDAREAARDAEDAMNNVDDAIDNGVDYREEQYEQEEGEGDEYELPEEESVEQQEEDAQQVEDADNIEDIEDGDNGESDDTASVQPEDSSEENDDKVIRTTKRWDRAYEKGYNYAGSMISKYGEEEGIEKIKDKLKDLDIDPSKISDEK